MFKVNETDTGGTFSLQIILQEHCRIELQEIAKKHHIAKSALVRQMIESCLDDLREIADAP